MVLNEKKVSIIRLLEKRMEACPSSRDSAEYLYMATAIQKEYETYLKKYKYGTERDELYNVPSLSNLIEPTEELGMLSPHPLVPPVFEEKPQKGFFVPGVSKRTKSMHNVYKNVANYQDAVKKMSQRDIAKLAQNRHNIPEMYKDEANWLYQMKTEVARTTYGFAKKY